MARCTVCRGVGSVAVSSFGGKSPQMMVVGCVACGTTGLVLEGEHEIVRASGPPEIVPPEIERMFEDESAE